MKKVALGDSFTYGEELADRNNAYPALLGYENWGLKGASNEYIFRKAVELAPKADHMIIAWSDSGRYELYTNKKINISNRYIQHNGIVQVNPGWTQLSPWFKELYGNYSDQEHQFLKTISYMVAIQDVLVINNVDYLQTSSFGNQDLFVKYQDSDLIKPWIARLDKTKFIDYPHGLVEWAYDTPQGPNGHPLELGHKRIADKIAEYI